MKGKLRLNLALLAAVAVLALVAYFKPQESKPEFQLSTLKPADVRSIRVELAGAPPIALERAAAEWRLVTPFAARADNFQAQRLLEILNARSTDRFPATGLARFDLNEASARLTFDRQSFSFGAVNAMSREQYVLTQDGVFLVGLRYGAALPKQALQLVSLQLFSPEEAPVAFEFKDFRLTRQDGKWQLAPPVAELSQDDLIRWVDEWRLATALAVLPASNRKPLATIKVSLKDGRETRLAVLQQEPDAVFARSDQPFEYQFAGETARRLLMPPATRGAK